ncbi:alpha-1,3-mannosyl-glycoprotein 4-beta-N-acetylglucosaminyltransferase A-like [Ciona intestinalis]
MRKFRQICYVAALFVVCFVLATFTFAIRDNQRNTAKEYETGKFVDGNKEKKIVIHKIEKLNKPINPTTAASKQITASKFSKFLKIGSTVNSSINTNSNVKPRLRLGKLRKRPLVTIGVPSVLRRRHDYLQDTLRSLLKGISDNLRKDVNILVYVAEANSTFVEDQMAALLGNYFSEIQEGIVQVIGPPFKQPEDWESKLFLNFGDSISRVRWRSRQNLDMINLLSYVIATDDPQYFLMMEDDVLANEGYMHDILMYVESKPTRSWDYCSFSTVGGAGKIFHRESAREFLAMLKLFWYTKPLDWLLWDFVRVKVCGYSDTSDICDEKIEERARKYFAPLFKHTGVVSSRTNPMFDNR